jgi:hypothetical protein
VAVIDATKSLYVFDIETGLRKVKQKGEPADGEWWFPLEVTNDGRYVYTIVGEGSLTRWDTVTGQPKKMVLQRLRETHSRSDFISLAENDTLFVAAGNHGDFGVFDALTGKLLSYGQIPAAAFFVEKVWVGGNRIVLTTDTGVMYSGSLR